MLFPCSMLLPLCVPCVFYAECHKVFFLLHEGAHGERGREMWPNANGHLYEKELLLLVLVVSVLV